MTNLPLSGDITITAAFKETGKYWATFHKGIDLVNKDKIIYSPCNGIVRVINFDKNGWGRYVTIGDGERIFILCHLVDNSVKVKVGQKVNRLTVIGTMGSTGNATGIHLHFQVEDTKGNLIDPCTWIGCENKRYTFNSKDFTVPADIDRVPNWGMKSVLNVYRKGIMIGNDKGDFDPNRNVSRVELAEVISKIIK